jgi:hypothetical protein
MFSPEIDMKKNQEFYIDRICKINLTQVVYSSTSH